MIETFKFFKMLVMFYGISIFEGYLMSNPVFIYVYMICELIPWGHYYS